MNLHNILISRIQVFAIMKCNIKQIVKEISKYIYIYIKLYLKLSQN